MTCPSCTAPAQTAPAAHTAPTFQDSSLLKIAKQIYRVAVTVLVMVVAPIPGAIGLAVGLAVGVGHRAWQLRHGIAHQENDTLPICAQGYAGLLSGERLPEAVGFLISAACLVECIVHHRSFYAPFTTLFTGAWMGAGAVSLLSKKISG